MQTEKLYRFRRAIKRLLLEQKEPVSVSKLLRTYSRNHRFYVRLAAHALAKDNDSGIYRLGIGWYAHTGMELDAIKKFCENREELFSTKEWVFMVLADNIGHPVTAKKISKESPVELRYETIQAMLSVMEASGTGDNYTEVVRIGRNKYSIPLEKTTRYKSKPVELVEILEQEGMVSAESLMKQLGVNRTKLCATALRAKSELGVKVSKMTMFYIEVEK